MVQSRATIRRPISLTTTAIKGDKKFSYQLQNVEWQNIEWHFSTASNMHAFKSDLEKFAPQNGGYCAYGVSFGYAPAVDTTEYSIVGGKLYRNYNHQVSNK